MLKFLLRAVIAALGLWLAAKVVPGVHVTSIGSLVAAAVLLGLVNAIVRPLAILLTLPFTLITLGLFLLVINAAMLGLVAWALKGFWLDGFWAALFGSVVVSLVSWIGNTVVRDRPT